uniref:Retrotransposon protein, putative, Ty1-copia subclass n=1 Tax=Oryza sativa subsp. japonica TaxID=39947 RepID=Q2QS45_ORYSJ|nr:retrotransposon protein, putative, Ty1-copia subclass [Oryza sativa Japonica Group]
MATPARFSTKPHVFDGMDFSHWCSRMQSYIMAEDYNIWRKVSHHYVIPEAINTAAEKTAFEQNCKARNILLSGTNNIKELHRDIFKKEYIKFEMKPGEALDDYLSRFNKILIDLRSVDSSYDANYPQSEISRHFLNGLDMSIWEMKVTSIQESVNMSTLTLDSLYTKLKTHEMNVLSRKVDSKSSALVSFSSSLDVDASSSKPSFLAIFIATSDDQLEQIEEKDLALVANRIARAMNNASNRKRGGPNRCFECGSIDHLRSHCPKLGRGKREDKDGEKTNNNKPKGSSQGRKLENLRKAFQQVCATFEPLSDVDGESRDDDKGKNISDVCIMACGESDTEYEDNELKQPHDVLDCSTCNLNKLKLKDALGRVEYMEDVVKKNEVLSCPKCRKSKGVMVDCENCANLEKEVSYLKNSLLRFSDGVGARSGEILVKPDTNKTVFKSAEKGERDCFCKIKVAKIWFSLEETGQTAVGPAVRPATECRLDRASVRPAVQRRSDRPPKASKTESIIFGDASTSAVLATGLVKGEDGCIFEDESGDNDDDEVSSAGQTGRQAGQTAGTPPVRPAHEERSDQPGSSGSGTVDADRNGPPEITTSTSTDTERGSTSEVAAPLHIQRRHPPEQIIGNIGERTTRSKVTAPDVCANSAFVASFEPKDVSHALTDESWINAMHEELENFERNKVWTLVEPPSGQNIIGTKWVFKNKQNEDGLIMRNKARLVAQGFTQVEGLDFDETFAPIAIIEAIRLLLAFAASKGFKLYQMDEEVYVKQPPGFENPDFPNHVFKLSKAFYGFKQAPRAWFDRLKNFLLAKGFSMGKIYVDDIIFCCSTHALVVDFEMSMMGELSYFLGLQIKQTPQGTFVHQTKYTEDLLRRFKMENCKPISAPIGSTAMLDPDGDGEAVD